MKKYILLVVLILPVVFSTGCKKWFNKSKQQEAYIKQLENKIRSDSAIFAEELQRVKEESQSIIDSLQSNCGKSQKSGNYAYYVITGAFMEPANADRYKAKMDAMGYTAEIIDGPFGYRMVSVGGSNNLNEAINTMNTIRNSVTENAWVYVKK